MSIADCYGLILIGLRIRLLLSVNANFSVERVVLELNKLLIEEPVKRKE
jgi:hypothetical protein